MLCEAKHLAFFSNAEILRSLRSLRMTGVDLSQQFAGHDTTSHLISALKVPYQGTTLVVPTGLGAFLRHGSAPQQTKIGFAGDPAEAVP